LGRIDQSIAVRIAHATTRAQSSEKIALIRKHLLITKATQTQQRAIKPTQACKHNRQLKHQIGDIKLSDSSRTLAACVLGASGRKAMFFINCHKIKNN
jgi:hypothetical protein